MMRFPVVRFVVLGLLFSMPLVSVLVSVLPSIAESQSQIEGNVPDRQQFRTLMIRDLTTEFTSRFGKGVRVEYELLREIPTQVGVATPKFYLWVTVTQPNHQTIEGAVKVAAINRKYFTVLTFINRDEIIKTPQSIDRVFPKALGEKIRTRAGIARSVGKPSI
jgi:hypothetical protein